LKSHSGDSVLKKPVFRAIKATSSAVRAMGLCSLLYFDEHVFFNMFEYLWCLKFYVEEKGAILYGNEVVTTLLASKPGDD
jgi:hypothetical protein